MLLFHFKCTVSGTDVCVSLCLLTVCGRFGWCALSLRGGSPSGFRLGGILVSKNKKRLLNLTDRDTL